MLKSKARKVNTAVKCDGRTGRQTNVVRCLDVTVKIQSTCELQINRTNKASKTIS